MRPRFQLKMQSLMVLVLVPALLVVIAAYGWSNYDAVYDVILGGFNRKLEAISTTSAAFVDGDEHERLIEPRDVQAIAFDTSLKQLVGVDRGNGLLLTIDPATGSSEELSVANADESLKLVRSIAYDESKDRLLGLLDSGKEIVAIEVPAGKTTPLLTLQSSVGAIAFGPKNDELYLAGETLIRVPLQKLIPVTIGKLGMPNLQGFLWDAESGEFIGVDSVSGYSFRINPKDSTFRIIGPLIQDGNDTPVNAAEAAASKQWIEPQLVKLPVHGVSLGPEEGAVFAVTDRLIKFSVENGKGDPAGFRAGFRSDSSALYTKYANPMTRVIGDRQLTYHYTTILPKENQLVYVLDGTQGEDHSPAGTEEEVDPYEWQRLDRVLQSGQPSQSDIKKFDIWGLLKVGTAAIYDHSGKIVALMGADVDISTINGKTRVALLEVLLVGALSLLLAGLASVSVTKRLLKPLGRLKESALQVAAGKYSKSLRISKPKEVAKLAQSFDRVRRALEERCESLEEKNRWFETHRRTHELIQLFTRNSEKNAGSAFLGEVKCFGASGWIAQGRSTLLWFVPEHLEPLASARLRSDIAEILSRIATGCGWDWEQLRVQLEPLFRQEVALFMLLDSSERAVYSLARRPAQANLISSANERRTCVLLEQPKLLLEPGWKFVFSSGNQENNRAEAGSDDAGSGLYAVLRGEGI